MLCAIILFKGDLASSFKFGFNFYDVVKYTKLFSCEAKTCTSLRAMNTFARQCPRHYFKEVTGKGIFTRSAITFFNDVSNIMARGFKHNKSHVIMAL